MSAGSGPGRRLTPAEEERAAVLYRDGASTRDVARELAISNSSAQRVRVRLKEAGRLTPVPSETPSSEVVKREDPGERTVTEHEDQALEMTPLPADDDAAELERLGAQREQLVADVGTYTGRAEASMQAVAALEQERMLGLAEGRDMQGLRDRRRNAEDDARDATDAARLAAGRLGELDRQIAAVQQRIQIAALGAELAEAIAARDEVLAATGERQRTAVLAVRTAAEEFTAALADERAAIERVEQLAAQIALGGPVPAVPAAQSTALWVHPEMSSGSGPVALAQAMYQARNGSVREVAVRLATMFGWLPPSPAELAAEAERVRALHAAQPVQPARPVQQVTVDPRFGASHGVDAAGRPLPPPSRAEMERRGYPEPARPVGWLGGQPFPG